MKETGRFNMRTILVLALLTFTIASATAQGYNYNWGNYQGQWLTVQGGKGLTCAPPFMNFDPFGRPVCLQNCQERRWETSRAGQWGYRWICNGARCFWQYSYLNNMPLYRYSWFNFTRRVRCR